MKRIAVVLACLAAAVAFAGCTAAQQQSVDALAANAKSQVSTACTIIQPVLVDLSASAPGDASLVKLAADNAKVCAAVAGLDPTSVQSLVGTVIPEAIGLIALLPVAASTQTTITIALGAASLALSNWLAVYGATPVASAPVAASA